jgi:hypothetical protein
MVRALSPGQISHNLSQDLAETMDLGQRLAALLRVLVAGVDVGLHRERRVVVCRPLVMIKAAPAAPLARR